MTGYFRGRLCFLVLLGLCSAASGSTASHNSTGSISNAKFSGRTHKQFAEYQPQRPSGHEELFTRKALRRLRVEEFAGAPPAAAKQAEAAAILAAKPDALLRNLIVKAQETAAWFPEGCDVAKGGNARRRRVVTSGTSNATPTAGACSAQCKATRGCNAWFWCNDSEGCRSEGDVALPHQGCHLENQQPAFPVEPPLSWPISTFVAGWQGAVGSPQPTVAAKRIAVVAPITAEGCALSYGEVALKQAFLNKRDWAMLHNHEFHGRPLKDDPATPGTWYRLQVLKQALEEIPASRIEWVLMADQDVMVDDMAFEIPLAQYTEQHLVLYGSQKLLTADKYQNLLSVGLEDRQQGLDTGVLLMRNSEWSLKFVTKALMYLEDAAKQATLQKKLQTWEPLLWEQNAVALLLQSPATLQRTAFESEYCINCAWANGHLGKLPFLKRFSECSFCSGARNSREQIYECCTEAAKQFAHSNKIMYALTGCGQSHGKSDLVASTDPGPRGIGTGSTSSEMLGSDEFSTQQGPVTRGVTFVQTNFFTMLFIGVFLLGFLHRRKKRRHSSE